MRPINFLVIFVFCFALVLFSLENTQSVQIKFVPGVDLQAPLCIELIIAMGLGSLLAWVFSAWSKLLGLLEIRKAKRTIREKDTKIQQLEKDLEQYKVETPDPNQSLPALSPKVETSHMGSVQ